MCDYHLSTHGVMHSEKIKTNRPRASQICIGVIIGLSIKTQLLCDVLIGRKLNYIDHAYCYQITGQLMTNPGASD